MTDDRHSRRKYLKYAGLLSAVGFAGCLGGDEEPSDDQNAEPDDDGQDDSGSDDDAGEEDENRVIVAPDGNWSFEPEELTISVGETVTWYFDAPGHNVSSHPDGSDVNENPDGAEPFASYEGENHFDLDEPGTEYEHTFEVPGEYTYVCTPHDGSMIGTIIVEE
ncbi:plastocyanin/azurin family copper-binding protein [Natrialbaceae archaeon AArc-T1-2]|uniref:plastocyanin/azurin family copper-binding protein n=1 Tax=Natrialbaceae archaeon AArc-T1-2 TaxID=3053904 RepID=UPI00255B2CC4|nr:plastocyanin/azurin family copper-binding protein [Natrialbaceae archaeon AArc-T1-2]WIV67006.1 plastocyanin/azurin family copper-binding protein [Natrialbaceae archaeon AArc-T1-2]